MTGLRLAGQLDNIAGAELACCRRGNGRLRCTGSVEPLPISDLSGCQEIAFDALTETASVFYHTILEDYSVVVAERVDRLSESSQPFGFAQNGLVFASEGDFVPDLDVARW